jgi:hypothetical protein
MEKIACDYHQVRFRCDNSSDGFLKSQVYIHLALVEPRLRNLVVTPIAKVNV